jgi:hypothetical protein
MKKILIILTVIQVVGILSSTYLSGSLLAGIEDMQGGIVSVTIFWGIWWAVSFFKGKNKK